MTSFQIQHISTQVHGRCLVHAPDGHGQFPLLIGFHGYGQQAEDVLTMLLDIPGSRNWLCCSIQALHAFYSRRGVVGASWMTSQDRELRIQENVRYVNAGVAQLRQTHPVTDTLVYFGFSQGTGMACRAAVLGEYPPAGIMLLGGDIPPDLENLQRMSRVLIGRGTHDQLYPQKTWEQDVARLKQSKLHIQVCEFDGSHELGNGYKQAAADFLHNLHMNF
jgi:predicted esterase